MAMLCSSPLHFALPRASQVRQFPSLHCANFPLQIECSSRPKKKATAHHVKTRPRKHNPYDKNRKGPTIYPPPKWVVFPTREPPFFELRPIGEAAAATAADSAATEQDDAEVKAPVSRIVDVEAGAPVVGEGLPAPAAPEL